MVLNNTKVSTENKSLLSRISSEKVKKYTKNLLRKLLKYSYLSSILHGTIIQTPILKCLHSCIKYAIYFGYHYVIPKR